MLKDNVLSTVPVLAPFVWAGNLPNTDLIDYDYGPIAIQDPTKGSNYQIWRLRYVNDTVYLVNPNISEYPLFVKRGLSTVGIAFDQNARYVLMYIINGDLHVYYYDSVAVNYVDTVFATGVTSARITLDDKRITQATNSRVILAYTRNDNLYFRMQSDRYGIERLLQENVGGVLSKIGLTTQYRFQFLFQAHEPVDYNSTWPWGDI